MKTFNKPALSGVAQLERMKTRGVVVADEEYALRRLRHIGYYRLSGYMLTLQKGGNGPDRHIFQKPTTFEEIVRLYVFDRKLRLLFLDGIERIEISARAALSGQIAVLHGPHWYEKATLFDARFDHDAYLTEIDRHLDKSTDIFINHYFEKYRGGPERPPCWMLFECMPFGTVSMTIKGLFPAQWDPKLGIHVT